MLDDGRARADKPLVHVHHEGHAEQRRREVQDRIDTNAAMNSPAMNSVPWCMRRSFLASAVFETASRPG